MFEPEIVAVYVYVNQIALFFGDIYFAMKSSFLPAN